MTSYAQNLLSQLRNEDKDGRINELVHEGFEELQLATMYIDLIDELAVLEGRDTSLFMPKHERIEEVIDTGMSPHEIASLVIAQCYRIVALENSPRI